MIAKELPEICPFCGTKDPGWYPDEMTSDNEVEVTQDTVCSVCGNAITAIYKFEGYEVPEN